MIKLLAASPSLCADPLLNAFSILGAYLQPDLSQTLLFQSVLPFRGDYQSYSIKWWVCIVSKWSLKKQADGINLIFTYKPRLVFRCSTDWSICSLPCFFFYFIFWLPMLGTVMQFSGRSFPHSVSILFSTYCRRASSIWSAVASHPRITLPCREILEHNNR